MSDPFIRTRMLIGDEPLARLAAAKVAVFGVGGVGGFCVEALARAGIGTLHLYDDDTVSESNLNRQLAALRSTIGRPKGEVLKERVKDINPACRVEAIRMFYLPENADTVDLTQYDGRQAGAGRPVHRPEHPHHQRHGLRQQAGPHRLCSHRPEQDPGLSPGPGDAQGTAQAGHPALKSGLLHRGAPLPHPPRPGGGPGRERDPSRHLRPAGHPRIHLLRPLPPPGWCWPPRWCGIWGSFDA